MRKTLLPLLCAVAVTVSAIAARADVLVAGKTLTIKDNVLPIKKKAIFLSKDATFTVGSLDPTMGGAFLTLASRGCHCYGPNNTICLPNQSSGSWFMPALNWTAKKGAFGYKDKTLANSPVLAAVIKNGQIKISAKGAQMDYGILNFLGQASGIRATFTVGATPVCALFPGTLGKVKKDDPVKGVYSAGNAEAPAACVDPPAFCQ
jgi:hypothetical protein